MAVDCAHCSGSGLSKEACWRCSGKGYFNECTAEDCDCTVECHVCYGAGLEPCEWCLGTGRYRGD